MRPNRTGIRSVRSGRFFFYFIFFATLPPDPVASCSRSSAAAPDSAHRRGILHIAHSFPRRAESRTGEWRSPRTSRRAARSCFDIPRIASAPAATVAPALRSAAPAGAAAPDRLRRDRPGIARSRSRSMPSARQFTATGDSHARAPNWS